MFYESRMMTAIDFDIPPGACDCHTHVFGDVARYPFAPTRVYTPPSASTDELLALQHALHFDRVVIVQPSVYGTDNSCTIDGMRALGDRARGVAVIAPDEPRGAIDEMDDLGIRGVRLNLETAGQFDPAAAKRLLDRTAEQIEGLGWHVQLFTRPAVIMALKDHLAQLPYTVVIDHFGSVPAAQGPDQDGLQALVDLLKTGRIYVKISGAYRISAKAPDFADVAPLARTLIAANPDRLVWGTDWPHPDSHFGHGKPLSVIAPPIPIDDGLLLNQLPEWAPDAATRRKILVDNPARLYEF